MNSAHPTKNDRRATQLDHKTAYASTAWRLGSFFASERNQDKVTR
jgi:hypothetical protein